jgi:hypothetical protein
MNPHLTAKIPRIYAAVNDQTPGLNPPDSQKLLHFAVIGDRQACQPVSPACSGDKVRWRASPPPDDFTRNTARGVQQGRSGVPPVWWTVLSLSSWLDLDLWFTSSCCTLVGFNADQSDANAAEGHGAESVRNDFQTPAAIGSQHQSVFSGYYTTQPASRRSLYELPRAS